MCTTLQAGLRLFKFHVLMIPRLRQCTWSQSKLNWNIFREWSTRIYLIVAPQARVTDRSKQSVSHASYTHRRLHDICASVSRLPRILFLTGHIRHTERRPAEEAKPDRKLKKKALSSRTAIKHTEIPEFSAKQPQKNGNDRIDNADKNEQKSSAIIRAKPTTIPISLAVHP